MKFKVHDVNLSSGGPLIVILNKKDATKLDIFPLDRLKIKKGKHSLTVVVDIAEDAQILPGHIGLFDEVLYRLKLKDKDIIQVKIEKRPKSVDYIKKKLKGTKLNQKQFNEIIKDIVQNRLSEIEITYFVSACYTNKLTLEESVSLTNAIVANSNQLKLNKKIIIDKHCLSGDVPIMVKNSGKTKIEGIGEIIDKIFDRCDKNEIININGAEFTDKNLNNLHVPSYDNDGEVSYKPVSGIFRIKSPKYLNKIILRGNRSIKLTEDHTIFILKNGCIKNIPSQLIKKGDFVIVPSFLKQEKNIEYIKIKKNYNIRNYRTFPNKIKITPPFIRLLAYYISEGFTNFQGVFLNFGSHEKELIEDSINCIKNVFGFNPTINKPHKTAIRVCMYSKVLSKIFKELNLGSNALDKSIPYFIFEVKNELKLEFLRTLIKCDGHLRRGYEAEYGTSSKKLFTQLQYLLSTMNISSSTHTVKPTKRKFKNNICDIHEHYVIYTQARELFKGRKKDNVSFINLLPIKEIGNIETKYIGWEFRRALKRQKFITKQKLKTIQNYILNKDINKFLDGHLSVLEVKNTDKIISDSKYVYDIKVDNYNKFMAGTAPMCVHNCVGGIPGNRTTMVVVPILAAAGLTIPKTSSRAITSPSGTADTMEVLAPVNLTIKQIQEVIKKTNACMVWGGTLELASADDKILKIERPLSLDPEGLLLASILAKKKAVNATHILIDIPYGKEAKIETRERALRLQKKFIALGKKLKMKIKVVLTEINQPIGNGVGPVLEARDVLEVLSNHGPQDLRKKSIFLANEMFKMVNKKPIAEKILNSGQAFEKMKEIIKAQGGKIPKFKLAKYKLQIKAKTSGRISSISNNAIKHIARMAGAPEDKEAGIYLHAKLKDKVKRNSSLFTIYADNLEKLNFIKETLKHLEVIKIT